MNCPWTTYVNVIEFVDISEANMIYRVLSFISLLILVE